MFRSSRLLRPHRLGRIWLPVAPLHTGPELICKAAGLLFLALLALPVHAVHSSSVPAPTLSAPAAVVIDGWTGDLLYAKHAQVRRAPASTVKVMTALVVLRHHVPLNRIVAVSALAVSYGGSTAGLYAGEQMRVRDLLYGMLLPSGNDAAIALSEAVAGTPGRFVQLMNAEAAKLHLTHTHYLTPNGFDNPGQVTSAHDLAEVARAAMHYRTFARVVRARTWTARSVDDRIVHVWTNVNHLLWAYPAVDGIKTGTTPGAGACLVSSARLHGKWVIEANLDSAYNARFKDGSALLNYGLLIDGAVPTAR